MPFLSNSLKALVTGTVTNGFPSVPSVLQHLVFKMSFQDVLFTAPSPLPGGDEKVILIFQRSPVNYSTVLCIAYSLHVGSLKKQESSRKTSTSALFIDYAKAFDCVDHNKLWKILQEMGISDLLTCLLRNLYAGQEATVRT